MQHCHDDEHILAAPRGFLCETLEQEHVILLGLPCGVFEILTKLIEDEQNPISPASARLSKFPSDRSQNLVRRWNRSRRGGTHMAESPHHSNRKRFAVAGRHHR